MAKDGRGRRLRACEKKSSRITLRHSDGSLNPVFRSVPDPGWSLPRTSIRSRSDGIDGLLGHPLGRFRKGVSQQSCQNEEKALYGVAIFAEKRSKHEDHLPIMSLRGRKQGNCQRLSKSRNHALVLLYFTRDAVYHVAAIEGRPIPRVPTVPRSERSPDEKKRLESI
jgi:hypothetical protein